MATKMMYKVCLPVAYTASKLNFASVKNPRIFAGFLFLLLGLFQNS
jgi:hypothetical protein